MRRSVALAALTLGLVLTLFAPTPAEASGRFRSRRACPPPCPAPCPPACCLPPGAAAPQAAPAAGLTAGVGATMACLVCDGGYWRGATADEFGNCVLKDISYLDQPCQKTWPEAAASPRRTCEPVYRLYCDHTTGWRFPRNWCEWQQSYCLPISHLGRQCWFPDGKAPPHLMPK